MAGAASFGYSACLGLQERFLQAVPEHIRGHALGLAGAGMMTAQALAAASAGVLAAGTVMAVAGAASLVTTALLPGLRTAGRGTRRHDRDAGDEPVRDRDNGRRG